MSDNNSQEGDYVIRVPSSHKLQFKLNQLLTDDYRHQSVLYAVEKVLEALGNVPHPKIAFSNLRVFRARTKLSDEEACDINSFHAPFPDASSLGRANLVGYPVFYGSFAPNTCCLELNPSEKDPIWIAEFAIKNGVKLLARNHVAFDPDHIDLSDPHSNYIASQVDEILSRTSNNWRTENSRDELIASMNAAAQIFTSGNHDLSARIAHNSIFNEQKPESAVTYSSVANFALQNIAVHPRFAGENFLIKRVFKCRWVKDKSSIHFLDVAYPDVTDTSRICWEGGMPSTVSEALRKDFPHAKVRQTMRTRSPDGQESITFDSAEAFNEYFAEKYPAP